MRALRGDGVPVSMHSGAWPLRAETGRRAAEAGGRRRMVLLLSLRRGAAALGTFGHCWRLRRLVLVEGQPRYAGAPAGSGVATAGAGARSRGLFVAGAPWATTSA